MGEFARISISMSPRDEQRIKKRAAAEGKSVSQFCREVLLDETENGVILREPLEKEMIALRETVQERMIDMVNIVENLSHGVVDKELSQSENIEEIKKIVKTNLLTIHNILQSQLDTINKRIEYQNKLTRELYKEIYYEVKKTAHYTRGIIETGIDNKQLAEDCMNKAILEADAAVKALGVE